MKHPFGLLVMILLVLSGNAFAQSALNTNCNFYAPATGTATYTVYSAGDRVMGYEEHTVERTDTSATVTRKHTDADKKLILEHTYTMTCAYNSTRISPLAWFHDPNLKKFYADYPKRWETKDWVIPNLVGENSEVGEAHAVMTITDNHFPLAKVRFFFSEGIFMKDTTVKIGEKTYKCHRLYVWQNTQVEEAANLVVQRQLIIYIDPEAGLIRKELFDKKGKLICYTTLNP